MKKIRLQSVIVVLAFMLSPLARGGDSSTSKNTTWWISSAPPAATREISQAPAAGVHPRVFFSTQDVPDIRKRAESTKMGKLYKEEIKKYLDDTIHKEGSKENIFYKMLCSGQDVPKLDVVPYENFARILMYEAFYALLTEDQERGKAVGAALANYARNYHYDQDEHRDNITSFLMSHDVNKFMALAYDFAYNWMTEEQRKVVRAEIAKMVDGREPYGWRQARWQRAYNHVGDHQFILWANLAIEGEEGYQPELTKKVKEVVRDYANLAIHPSGFAAESIIYTYFGFESTSRCMLAFARRGVNMFADTNFRFYKNYLLYNLCQFDPDKVDSHGDGGPGEIRFNPMIKFMYPEDPQVDWLHSRATADINRDEKGWGYFGYQWLFGIITSMDPENTALKEPAELKLENNVFCPERGELITRTGWGKDDIKFDIECREDISVIGHQHCSRGGFYLQALGRDWVVDRGYHQAESHRHSLVHIDGVGQSGWPGGPGKVLEMKTGVDFSLMACDAKYAYDWELRAAGWFDPVDLNGWEAVTFPYREKYPDEMTRELPIKERRGDGTFGHFPDTTIRKPYNTVERAIRTGMLIKGTNPYVLIFDDIKKDEQRHLYEWYMQVADDLEIKSCNGKMVILGVKDSDDKKEGEPRLMVRVLGLNDEGSANQWAKGAQIPFSRAMAVKLEKYVAGRNAYEGGSLNTRISIPALSSDPRYKVLLYPFRTGDPIPVTKYEDDKLTVRFPGQEDIFTMANGNNGRTVFQLSRNGRELIPMPEGTELPQKEKAPATGKDKGDNLAVGELLAHYSCDDIRDAISAPDGIPELSGLKTGSVTDATGKSPAGKIQMAKTVDGIKGKAFWLDGKWSDFKLPIDLGKRTDSARKKLTVSLWIKPDEIKGSPFDNGGNRGMGIGFVHGKFRVYSAEDWWLFTAPLPEKMTEKWTHIVLVRDGDITRLFLDGKLAGEKNRESSRWQFDTPQICSGYRGAVDEVRIYNRALPDEEINELFKDRK